MTVRIHFDAESLAALARFGELDAQKLISAALQRSRREIASLYRQHLRREIRATTTKRSGALLRRIDVNLVRQPGDRSILIFVPSFPRTEYRTPANRGRMGASKRGQYAFVVNAKAEFIGRANRSVQHDDRLARILQKHLAYLISRQLNLQSGDRT